MDAMVRFMSDIFIMPSINIDGSGPVLVWLVNIFTVQSYLQWRGRTFTCLRGVQILPYLCRQGFPLARSCLTVPKQNTVVTSYYMCPVIQVYIYYIYYIQALYPLRITTSLGSQFECDLFCTLRMKCPGEPKSVRHFIY